MSDFIEVKASARSLVMRGLTFGVGVNDAWYKVNVKSNGKSVRCQYYSKWESMLQRTYSGKFHVKNSTYKGCSVCKEWLIFSNFKAWMQSQEWRGKALDKDILSQGNKRYSPDFCCFVPQSLNNLLVDSKAIRGSNPLGVSFHKKTNKYEASIKVDGKKKYLGLYLTSELASDAYKVGKYNYIKEVATQQSDLRLRDALLRWDLDFIYT